MKPYRWQPGLSGFMCLAERGSKQNERPFRPYYVVHIDEDGQCEVREGPASWSECYYDLMPKLAEKEGKETFTTPLEREFPIWWEHCF